MSASLKLVISDNIDDNIHTALASEDIHTKINALSQIDSHSINSVLDQVKLCAYDYRAVVRAYAYKALKYADSSKITSVLKDATREDDKAAFKAARELFHKIDS